ncbi:MAG: adaptor protein MecA [Lachnospiraceae bacterium]|nr:adaptor protein MecA [Lachnospiraceae bacterium]
MKIEKISDTQIRCTLSRQDLADRDLKLSELAYGSDKAKDLFREMMVQASYECGFEAEDIPLMIEAIPVSGDCLVLVVTKVEDPDELDTRFSNFSSFRDTGDEDSSSVTSSVADEILECFGQLGALLGKGKEAMEKAADTTDTAELPTEKAAPAANQLTKVFSFPTLTSVTKLAQLISPYYFGENTLYKDEVSANYYLVLHMSGHTPEEFNRICNVTSEYGLPVPTGYASLSYFAEHFKPVLKNDAVQTLAVL